MILGFGIPWPVMAHWVFPEIRAQWVRPQTSPLPPLEKKSSTVTYNHLQTHQLSWAWAPNNRAGEPLI